MDRAKPGGYAGVIDYIRNCIPKRINDQIRTDWFCGTDPVFAGLHDSLDTFDGRSYRDTAHTCYPYHIAGPRDRKRMTIVLPTVPDWYTVLHELGHVLDHRLEFSHTAAPVTEYAGANRQEAFAEAFSTWIIGPSRHEACNWESLDSVTVTLFGGLWR